MKKLFGVIFFIIILNTVVFAGVEVPEYIKVKMSDGRVQEIELDTYLYGVVQSEMGTAYKASGMKSSEEVPIEALKAQAVASRSYAVYKILSAGEDADYHVTSTTSSQVYKNITPHENVKEAVDETAGQVILYDGEVIEAFFFSTSGGHTEAPENVWYAEIPYLKGVEDEYEIEVDNKTTWTAVFNTSDLERIFPTIGEIEDVRIVQISENDRVTELRIEGSKAEKILLKNGIRTTLGASKVKSQWFEVDFDGDEAIFEGRGFGHGVGMSQNGAIGMALEGFEYDEILKWYYTDVEILGVDEDRYGRKDRYDDDNEKYEEDYNEDDEQDEEKTEEMKPLLEKLTVACSTNWLLEYIKG